MTAIEVHPAEWLAPFTSAGAPTADARWTWSRVTPVLAAAKDKTPGHRAIVHVVCPVCDCLVGRVDVLANDEYHPLFVTWHEGGQVG